MFRHMDEIEIEIGRIKDLQMIYFYNLVAHGDELPAIVVYYGDKQQINLSSLDKHYDKLLEKVAGLYAASSHDIVMDEETEKVLKNWKEEQLQLEKKYEGGSNEPVFYPDSYMDYFITPIMKYYAVGIYKIFSKDLVMHTYSGAWHGRGRMTGSIGEQTIGFPYIIRKTGEGEYKVYIGNFLKDSAQLLMDILYTGDGLRVTFKSEELGLTGGSSYLVDADNKSVYYKDSISIDGKAVYENSEKLDTLSKNQVDDIICKLEEDGIKAALSDLEALTWVRLPWGQNMSVFVSDEESDEIKRRQLSLYYLFLTKERDYLRKTSYRNVRGKKSGVCLNTFLQAAEVYVKKTTKNMIQVHYDPAKIDSNGEYKKYLSDRFYYYEGEMKAFI